VIDANLPTSKIGSRFFTPKRGHDFAHQWSIPDQIERYVGLFSMQWHPTRAGIIFGLSEVQSWWKHFSPQRWFGVLL